MQNQELCNAWITWNYEPFLHSQLQRLRNWSNRFWNDSEVRFNNSNVKLESDTWLNLEPRYVAAMPVQEVQTVEKLDPA